jgi:hypothetical protein
MVPFTATARRGVKSSGSQGIHARRSWCGPERLGAIVSKLSLADVDADVMRLLVYSKIVESFNNERAVIPMRYGCRFESIGDIVEFLKKEQGTFGALLDELDGRVEMSVNVILDASRDERERPASRGLSSPMPAGIGYLAGRRRYYSLGNLCTSVAIWV